MGGGILGKFYRWLIYIYFFLILWVIEFYLNLILLVMPKKSNLILWVVGVKKICRPGGGGDILFSGTALKLFFHNTCIYLGKETDKRYMPPSNQYQLLNKIIV